MPGKSIQCGTADPSRDAKWLGVYRGRDEFTPQTRPDEKRSSKDESSSWNGPRQ